MVAPPLLILVYAAGLGAGSDLMGPTWRGLPAACLGTALRPGARPWRRPGAAATSRGLAALKYMHEKMSYTIDRA